MVSVLQLLMNASSLVYLGNIVIMIFLDSFGQYFRACWINWVNPNILFSNTKKVMVFGEVGFNHIEFKPVNCLDFKSVYFQIVD